MKQFGQLVAINLLNDCLININSVLKYIKKHWLHVYIKNCL